MAAPAAPPDAARAVFGAQLSLAQRYAELLTSAGVEWGLLGPREADRVWDRHVLNSAVIGELVPPGARVIDVGSGAGLPGLAVAIARPDLSVALLEPLQRRVRFLAAAVAQLELSERVAVVRGRAEDLSVREHLGAAEIVTARAVAPLDRLMRWCLPLLAPGGWLLAVKGRGAADELATHSALARQLGVSRTEVVRCGSEILDPATTVVRLQRGGTAHHQKGQPSRDD